MNDVVNLSSYNVNCEIAKLIPENISRRYKLIAIDKKGDRLVVAMKDCLNMFAIDDVRISTGYNVYPVKADENDILKAIEYYYKKEEIKKIYNSNIEKENNKKNLIEINNAPIVKLVNFIISEAIKRRASDIHIEPFENEVRVRFRIDGDLQQIMKLSKVEFSSIVTRIKIMGKMNIANRMIPQDGRCDIEIFNRRIDMRLSTLPTMYGEKIVIRILDKENFYFSKHTLGFSVNNLKVLDKILNQPYGMILVTGPTGSGKTTTLYAILRELNKIEKNIITIEDPIEYKLEGINQVQLNNKAGLNFANGLRSILRQDPDIIMIGEIRDLETAEIAIRAAITGHLVLSTLHTNDTSSTIARLVDMGIKPYLISSSVIAVISQRLIKCLCKKCKIQYKANYDEKDILGISKNNDIKLFKTGMCRNCIKGYKGRIAVHEIMIVDKALRKIINDGASIDEIKKCAIDNGMVTLEENCKKLVLKGNTTIEQMLKVIYTLN